MLDKSSPGLVLRVKVSDHLIGQFSATTGGDLEPYQGPGAGAKRE
jgi:hypothetical protein